MTDPLTPPWTLPLRVEKLVRNESSICILDHDGDVVVLSVHPTS